MNVRTCNLLRVKQPARTSASLFFLRLVVVKMSHNEDQEMEIEALESLFSNEGEFKLLSPTKDTFELNLLPHPNRDQQNHVEITIRVKYLPLYPDVKPEWSLTKRR